MAFEREWDSFLNNIVELAALKEDYNGLPGRQSNFQGTDVLTMFEETTDRLREEESGYELNSRLQEDSEEWANRMDAELQMWNYAAEQETSPYAEPTEDDLDARLGQAKTIKDSIEKYIPIPKPIQRLLEGLNELLSLVT